MGGNIENLVKVTQEKILDHPSQAKFSVTKLAYFRRSSRQIILQNVAQISCDIWGHFLSKNCLATLWATFRKIWLLFIPTSGHTSIIVDKGALWLAYLKLHATLYCKWERHIFATGKLLLSPGNKPVETSMMNVTSKQSNPPPGRPIFNAV